MMCDDKPVMMLHKVNHRFLTAKFAFANLYMSGVLVQLNIPVPAMVSGNSVETGQQHEYTCIYLSSWNEKESRILS